MQHEYESYTEATIILMRTPQDSYTKTRGFLHTNRKVLKRIQCGSYTTATSYTKVMGFLHGYLSNPHARTI